MPVSVACDSTVIMTALRDAVARPLVKINYCGSNESLNNLQNQLAVSAKRILFTTIEYEEIGCYNQTILDVWNSKYTILKPVLNERFTLGVDLDNSIKEVNRNQVCFGISAERDQLPKPKKILYPRQNIQIGWQSSGRKWQVGAGMINVGNTCYLNSTLQALFHVPAMANWLMSDVIHREKCEDDDGNSGGCIICAMAKTLISSQTNQGPIRPYLVYTKLRLVCKHLIMGRQEDAHEFLRYLVEAMEKSYLARIPNSKEFDQYSKETTPLNQILGGYLKSAVRCLACGHVSTTFQHFQDILLDIRKANSVEEALDVYFARERLEDMGYKCEACKKKVSATKQFSLERAPISLCIQLKRFSMMGSKLNKHVTIRPRLDLSPYAGKKCKENLSYKLVAMVTHLGASQHCGHYTAIGLTETGAYYQFDDSSVRPISLQNVVNTNAYIIFYELDDKDINRYSYPLISCEKVNTFKQTANKLYPSNSDDNEPRKQCSTVANTMINTDTSLNQTVDGMSGAQPIISIGARHHNNKIEATLHTISSNKKKNSVLSEIEKKVDKSSKKCTIHHSEKLDHESINEKIIVKEIESYLNSQSTNISASSCSHVLCSDKSNSNSTKIRHTETNGKNEKQIPNSSCYQEKYCVSGFLADPPAERCKPNLLKSNQAKINGKSKSDNSEYLKICPESNDLKNQDSAESTKANYPSEKTHVQSLVPYDSDDESVDFAGGLPKQGELSAIVSFKSLKKYCDSENTISSPCYSGEYSMQLSKNRQNFSSSPIVKTKAGFWQVTDIEENQYKKFERSQKSVIIKGNSKIPHASPAATLQKVQPVQNERNKTIKEGNTIHNLLKSSHQGLIRPVFTWWGQKSSSEKQAHQSKQGRNRDLYEDDNLLEYGRQKKIKLNDSFVNQGNPGYNPFQEYQNNASHHRRWNNIHRRYHQNCSHRNHFHRKSYNKKRIHRKRNRLDVNYHHRRNN